MLFHDAVRPLVDHRIIGDCVDALQTYEAVDVAIPSADTIVGRRRAGLHRRHPEPRPTLRRGQTPQAFRLSTIRQAYELGCADPDFPATDDCGVVLRYLPDVPIYVVDGSEQNMKITDPIDLFLADKLFQLGSTIRPDARRRPRRTPSGCAGRDRGRVRRQLRHRRATSPRSPRGIGAKVFPSAAAQTDTNVERPEDIERALAEAHAASPAGSTTSS